MPVKRSYRSRRPRKARRVMRGRRRYAKRNNYALTTRMRGLGFSDKIATKLKYVDSFTINSAFLNQKTYRGNSLFDPDVSIGGHQPMFYDQYIAVYGKYRVLASSLKLQIINSSAASVYTVILPATTPVSFPTIATILEQNKASSLRIVPPQEYLPQQQKRYMSTAKATGATKRAVHDDDTYAALFNADPVDLWYWNIVFESIDASTTLNLTCLVTLYYYVEFFDRQLIAGS